MPNLRPTEQILKGGELVACPQCKGNVFPDLKITAEGELEIIRAGAKLPAPKFCSLCLDTRKVNETAAASYRMAGYQGVSDYIDAEISILAKDVDEDSSG
jgi:hypothetical protein